MGELGDFTDLHGHFLFGVDDGPKTMPEAMQMLDGMVALGYTRVAVTPHHYPHRFPGATPAAVDAALSALRTARGDALPELALGAEYMFEPGLIAAAEAGRVRALNCSRYLLVEFPQGFNPHGLREVCYRLQLAGKIMVLAHPERWPELMERRELIDELVRLQSAALQLDLLSLMGKHGRGAKKGAQALLKADQFQLVASDAHTAKDISRLAKSLAIARKLIDSEQFQRLFVDNPLRVWRDQALLWGDG